MREFGLYPGAMGTHRRAQSGRVARSDVCARKVLLGAAGQTDWRKPGQRQRASLEAVITAEGRHVEEVTHSSSGEAEKETEPMATRGW